MTANELSVASACFQCTDPGANWSGAVYLAEQFAEVGPVKDKGQLLIEGDGLVIEGEPVKITG